MVLSTDSNGSAPQPAGSARKCLETARTLPWRVWNLPECPEGCGACLAASRARWKQLPWPPSITNPRGAIVKRTSSVPCTAQLNEPPSCKLWRSQFKRGSSSRVGVRVVRSPGAHRRTIPCNIDFATKVRGDNDHESVFHHSQPEIPPHGRRRERTEERQKETNKHKTTGKQTNKPRPTDRQTRA